MRSLHELTFPVALAIAAVAPAAAGQFQVQNLGVSVSSRALTPQHLLFVPSGGTLRVRTLATGTTVDTGLAASIAVNAVPSGRLVFTAPENGVDRNGDGDGADTILFRFDDATGLPASTALAASMFMSDFEHAAAAAVSEAQQGGIDLDGDGDAKDLVLHWIDLATGAVTNLGIPATGLLSPNALRDGAISFSVSEADWGAQDLDGNGASDDVIPALYVFATGTLHLIPEADGPAGMGDGFAMFRASEASLGGDRNGDGDADDLVPVVVPLATLSHVVLPFAVQNTTIAGRFALLEVREPDQGGADLDGDGDALDHVWFVHDSASGQSFGTGFAATSSDFAFPVSRYATSERGAIILASEAADGGHDRNGDGDSTDFVAQAIDFESHAVVDLGLAPAQPLAASAFVLSGSLAAILDSEAFDHADRNGDGDFLDDVLFVHDFATGGTVGVGVAAAPPVVLAPPRVWFTQPESGGAVAVDLNGDGDAADRVYSAFDQAAGSLVAVGLARATAAFPTWAAALGEHAILGVAEPEQGATDLNGDGDHADPAIQHLVHLDAPACGATYPYGAACAGLLGRAPGLAASGCAAAGATFGLGIAAGPPAGLALLFVGVHRADVAAGAGCHLLVQPSPALVLALPLSAAGGVQVQAALPAAAAGAAAVAQAFVLAGAPPSRFAATGGLEFHLVP